MNPKGLLSSLGLKWRLILGVSALLLVSSALLSIFLIGEFSDSAIDSLKRRGTSLARNLSHNAEFGVMLENPTELEVIMSGVIAEQDVLFAHIYTVEGALLSQKVRPGFDKQNIPTNDECHELIQWARSAGKETEFPKLKDTAGAKDAGDASGNMTDNSSAWKRCFLMS